MGGQQQSKSAAAVAAHEAEKAVLDRLRSLSLEDDEDYVEIDGCGEKASDGPPMVRNPEAIFIPELEGYIDKLLHEPKNRLAVKALGWSNPRHALMSRTTKNADQQVFNVKIPFEGAPITDQQMSGRCWIFASTNIFRIALMKKYNLESFQLSQAYLFYWDKLEKCNWFLEQIIDTADEDLDGRLVRTLMGDIASDGGQWDMVYNLVAKYGLVPRDIYPDSWNATNSGVLNSIVQTKMREFALTLRKLCSHRSGGRARPVSPGALSDVKRAMIQEISLILTLLLGDPPRVEAKFNWQYQDKNGKAHELQMTPKAFAQDIYSSDFKINSTVIEGMISLVNDPRNELMTKLSVSRLGNTVGGRGVTYVNVEMEMLKDVCVKMLKGGYPVFFGCDVGKFSDQASGVMDLNLFDYEAGIDTDVLRMSKAERLRTGDSQMTHAMVLTGVHLGETTGKPVRWRVQNSWGTSVGQDGWFVMSDAWMSQFLYQAVVDVRFCSQEVKDVLNQEALILPLWDPMGSLA